MRTLELPSVYELTTVQREIWEVLSLAQDYHDIKLVAGADIVEIKAIFLGYHFESPRPDGVL
jgi:hypothetical protein